MPTSHGLKNFLVQRHSALTEPGFFFTSRFLCSEGRYQMRYSVPCQIFYLNLTDSKLFSSNISKSKGFETSNEIKK
jgi:hypothetical protein